MTAEAAGVKNGAGERQTPQIRSDNKTEKEQQPGPDTQEKLGGTEHLRLLNHNVPLKF